MFVFSVSVAEEVLFRAKNFRTRQKMTNEESRKTRSFFTCVFFLTISLFIQNTSLIFHLNYLCTRIKTPSDISCMDKRWKGKNVCAHIFFYRRRRHFSFVCMRWLIRVRFGFEHMTIASKSLQHAADSLIPTICVTMCILLDCIV